ncbi:hypothetical protein INT45_001973 [Circinella minor]|uniref:Integrase catalytic domain-containing protein n=1 Tax=Circinella minor TaxID=1195481 RepID=A0A8H7VD74_9FUNG|nr:hypothetical protein INT45_001973 [Circinella minor]
MLVDGRLYSHSKDTELRGPELLHEGKPPKYLLVAIDYLTRWPIVAVVENITEETTAEFLFTHLSHYMREFLKGLGCRHVTATSARAQVNGMCERMNQGVVQTIAKLVCENNDEEGWEKYVGHALLAIRTMPNEATGLSPAKLLFGYELRTPATWPSLQEDFVEGELEDAIISRTKVIEHMSRQLRDEARTKGKEREQVLMRDKVPQGKFSDKWLGPMVVVGIGGNGTYYLEGPNSRRLTAAVNGDNLKAFFEHHMMIPDVQVQRAMNQYHAWIDRRQED